jgi:hypothetical protein
VATCRNDAPVGVRSRSISNALNARSAADRLPNLVQTFCTSSRRPETGRSRRSQGACPCRRCRLARDTQAARRLACRSAESGRSDDSGIGVVGLGWIWPAADPHGQGDAAELPRQAVARCGRRARAAARIVSGPLLRGQGRFASQATAASGRP